MKTALIISTIVFSVSLTILGFIIYGKKEKDRSPVPFLFICVISGLIMCYTYWVCFVDWRISKRSSFEFKASEYVIVPIINGQDTTYMVLKKDSK